MYFEFYLLCISFVQQPIWEKTFRRRRGLGRAIVLMC